MRLASCDGSTTFDISAGSAAWIIVLPIPTNANVTTYRYHLSAFAKSGTTIATTVTASETRTAFFRPMRPESTPVGIEITRNQTYAKIGISHEIESAFAAHSALTWFITVPMMSPNPITKNPARSGSNIAFLFIPSFPPLPTTNH